MATNKPSFLFIASHSVDDRLGEVLSFIWANFAGLRELWWQVRGFSTQFPHLPLSDVEKKFMSGLPIPGGIDFRDMFTSRDWSRHEQEFARWLIFDTCTLYEGWAESVCLEVFGATHAEKMSKSIQFPEGIDKKGKPAGYVKAITKVNAARSNFMYDEFFPTIKASSLNCWGTVNEQLIAYRYFKECRNAFIHSGGMATEETINARAAVYSEQTKVPPAGTFPPYIYDFKLPWQKAGEKIKLNLMDCISFSALVRKLIYTFDAALCVASTTELLIEERLKKLTSSKSPKWKFMPGDPVKLEKRAHRMLSAARIPDPVDINNVISWMQIKGVI
jgi:hypothetical protein